jgi:hypothetical protein
MSFLTATDTWTGCEERESVYVAGRLEADRHKWIESQKVGFDLGELAIRQWVRDHWRGFLRARWLEHLYGRKFWLELDKQDYGLLRREFQGSPLIGPILDLLLSGGENLNVILEARLARWPMPDVITILEALDINSRRLEFVVESRLARSES